MHVDHDLSELVLEKSFSLCRTSLKCLNEKIENKVIWKIHNFSNRMSKVTLK